MTIQDELNEATHLDWKNGAQTWHRAIWLEAAEAIESCPWKWWKKGDMNIENVRIEIIDMWHFALSLQCLEHKADITLLESELSEVFNRETPESDDYIIDKLENIAQLAINKHAPNEILWSLAGAASTLGMNYDDLTKLYVGKSVLNKFRQDNGYKEGTYIKMWGESEDNVSMQLKIAEMEICPEFAENLKASLEITYEDIKPVQ